MVPGALYRHVRSKEQLYDLVLDHVLAEVDCQADHSLDWAGQVTTLAQRLRAVLEDHPGIAGLLKTRDPLSPHSLALAEAFLAPLHAAGMPERQAALAFRLIYDYTLGFALSDRTSASEQRLQDTATGTSCTRSCGHCPPTSFPYWPPTASTSRLDDRDERFTASLHTLISGLQSSPARPSSPPALTTTGLRNGATHSPASASSADDPKIGRHPLIKHERASEVDAPPGHPVRE